MAIILKAIIVMVIIVIKIIVMVIIVIKIIQMPTKHSSVNHSNEITHILMAIILLITYIMPNI
jgi:hypothetical protein